MPPTLESKVLDYFRTAPIPSARLMLNLATDEVRRRSEPIPVPASKAKRGRPRKEKPAPAAVNGVEQPGEPVEIASILSQ